MNRLTDRAHEICGAVLSSGDVAIDATLGNGHDTLFLANTVGPDGRVYGFDIQERAIDLTSERLGDPLRSRVELLRESHAQMETFIAEEDRGRIQVIMFNLGYLPGGEKEITTRTESTLAALEASCRLLHPEGVISIIAYPGHDAGLEETEAVAAYLNDLTVNGWNYQMIEAVPGSDSAPRLFLLRRQGGS
ncbi:MAG: methyltransferase domain-containing protein [Planctomycetaceae bacterium]|nr:methyltransferase domain-containing protein [Planctomycetaceae bacterium]